MTSPDEQPERKPRRETPGELQGKPPHDAGPPAEGTQAGTPAEETEAGTPAEGTQARRPAAGTQPGTADEARTAAPASAPAPAPAPSPTYADRVFRSGSGIAAGVVLLAVGVWLAADAVIRGTGRVPWLTLAALILGAPLVVAYTLRPAVYANAERLKIRNPFRTITLPWSAVEGVRSGYSSEVFAAGTKYQLWAIPVSLRARKKAARQQARAAMDAPRGRTTPPPTTSRRPGATTPEEPPRAPSDQAIEDLRDLAERHAADPAAQGEPTVRWAYEILAPVVAGLVLLGVLLLVG